MDAILSLPFASQAKRLNVFERYLSLWVLLCMLAGVVLGLAWPAAVGLHARAGDGQRPADAGPLCADHRLIGHRHVVSPRALYRALVFGAGLHRHSVVSGDGAPHVAGAALWKDVV